MRTSRNRPTFLLLLGAALSVAGSGDSLTAFETVKVFDAAGAAAPETLKPLLGARIRLP